MKDEITRQKVLVLNNISLLRVVCNNISAIEVLVTFSPKNVDYVFLNEFNIEMLTFVSKTDCTSLNNDVKAELIQIKGDLISDKSKMEFGGLKYVLNRILFI